MSYEGLKKEKGLDAREALQQSYPNVQAYGTVSELEDYWVGNPSRGEDAPSPIIPTSTVWLRPRLLRSALRYAGRIVIAPREHRIHDCNEIMRPGFIEKMRDKCGK